MTKICKNIEEFLKFEKTCIFCGNSLQPRLTSAITYKSSNKSCIYDSVFNEDNCKFSISYTSARIDVDAVGIIDSKSNAINFISNSSSLENPDPPGVNNEIADVFYHLAPHFELFCNNKKCKTNYYICSNTLNGLIYNHTDEYIKPFKLYCEAANAGKYWVQNDWETNRTNIYSIIHSDATPITIPLLDFKLFNNRELFKNKIKTITTFI